MDLDDFMTNNQPSGLDAFKNANSPFAPITAQEVKAGISNANLAPQPAVTPSQQPVTQQPEAPEAWYDRTFREYRANNPGASDQDAYNYMSNLIAPTAQTAW